MGCGGGREGRLSHLHAQEIYEQPQAVAETLLGRISPAGEPRLEETGLTGEVAQDVDKVFVVACGTSYHAGMMAKYALERWAKIPVEVELSSEFRYRDPVLSTRSLVIGISQSGETADTLAAVRYARGQGAKVAAVTNVVGSSLAGESHMVFQTRAAPRSGWRPPRLSSARWRSSSWWDCTWPSSGGR